MSNQKLENFKIDYETYEKAKQLDNTLRSANNTEYHKDEIMRGLEMFGEVFGGTPEVANEENLAEKVKYLRGETFKRINKNTKDSLDEILEATDDQLDDQLLSSLSYENVENYEDAKELHKASYRREKARGGMGYKLQMMRGRDIEEIVDETIGNINEKAREGIDREMVKQRIRSQKKAYEEYMDEEIEDGVTNRENMIFNYLVDYNTDEGKEINKEYEEELRWGAKILSVIGEPNPEYTMNKLEEESEEYMEDLKVREDYTEYIGELIDNAEEGEKDMVYGMMYKSLENGDNRQEQVRQIPLFDRE